MKINASFQYSCNPKQIKKYDPKFNGYSEVINTAMSMPMTKSLDAEGIFGKLIKEIDIDKSIKKTNYFKPINDIFERIGFKNLLKVLTKGYKEDKTVEAITNYMKKWNALPLAKEDNDIFKLITYSGKIKDIRLSFNPIKETGGIEFFNDRKGRLFVEQNYKNNFFSTGFYSDTGTIKETIESFAGELPERTFYNKDGSKPFFLNFLFGGTPVNGMI